MKNVRDLLHCDDVTILVILGFIPAIPLGFIPVPIVLQNLGVMLGNFIGLKKELCRFFYFKGCSLQHFQVALCLLFC